MRGNRGNRRFIGWGKKERYSSIAVFVIGILIFTFAHWLDSMKPPLPQELKALYDSKSRQYIEFGTTDPVKKDFNQMSVNAVNLDQLFERGMDKRMAQRFIKYRDLSGGFKDEAQVLKVYGVTDSLVSALNLSYPLPLAISDKKKESSKRGESKWQSGSFMTSKKGNVKHPKAILAINKTQFGEMKELGVPDWLARNIINNRKRLGNFKNQSDVLTTYGLDSALFFNKFDLSYDTIVKDRIAVVSIEESSDTIQALSELGVNSQSKEKINLNIVDSSDLVAIRGIGAKTAGLLLNKRRKLGGFINMEQVLSYRLHPKVKETIKTTLIVDGPVNRLNVSNLSVEQLAVHPYLSIRQVEYLKNNSHIYRKGKLPSRHNAYFTELEWERVSEYLEF